MLIVMEKIYVAWFLAIDVSLGSLIDTIPLSTRNRYLFSALFTNQLTASGTVDQWHLHKKHKGEKVINYNRRQWNDKV